MEGDGDAVLPNGNLALMDGTHNPAAVAGQLINGTAAHVLIKVATDATYTLKNPNGLSWTQPSHAGQTLFQAIPLVNGWWALDGPAGQVTKFEVTDYTNLAAVQSYQVVKAASIFGCVFACVGNFEVKDLTFDSPNTPECTASGQNSPDATLSLFATPHPYQIRYSNTIWSRTVDLGDVALFTHQKIGNGWAPPNVLVHSLSGAVDIVQFQPVTLESDSFFILSDGGSIDTKGLCQEFISGSTVLTEPRMRVSVQAIT